jgi:hypothetical protein
MWSKSNPLVVFALDLMSAYEGEHTIFGLFCELFVYLIDSAFCLLPCSTLLAFIFLWGWWGRREKKMYWVIFAFRKLSAPLNYSGSLWLVLSPHSYTCPRAHIQTQLNCALSIYVQMFRCKHLFKGLTCTVIPRSMREWRIRRHCSKQLPL